MNNWANTALGRTPAGFGAAGCILAISILSSVPASAQSGASAGTPVLAMIMQPIFAAIGTVIATVLAVYVPKALAAFLAQTRIQLTDQQRATVLGAVRTAAGMIETNLDQGAIRMAHVDIANPAVRAEAVNAINAVPIASAALNMTVDGMARMIVGAVDTRTHGVAAGVAPIASGTGSPR